MLKAWEDLPLELQSEEVRPYYDILAKKKGTLLLKRIFDIILAFFILIFLSPLFVIIALVIKIDSPGPVFFRQVRITQYGREFRIFKFRTMVVSAEKLGNQITVSNDMRITKIGLFLRKGRLDEIPQLFNILIGDMSFVGPRPEVPKFVQQYTRDMMATLLLPAGVTSLASILYKDEALLLSKASDVDKVYVQEILPEKMKYNLDAIKNFSFYSDIKMMFITLLSILGVSKY